VAALENIRLDLLRLQIGRTSLDSVTASIDAARRVGDQIAESIAAQAAVERLLREERPAPEAGDEDADTPVGGVMAARP
jgi:hypothetical protein